MDKKYQSYLQNPELLKGRFESGFPLLYPMDTVRVSSRWAGNGKNPLEGRLGYVHNVSHGLQSRFNRDYLIAGLMGGEELGNGQDFESWLYTLDLVDKDETTGIANSVQKQFGCLLYIDDRIKVVRNSPFNGKTGIISSLQGTGSEGGWLGLEVSDEATAKEIRRLYGELNKKATQEFQRRNVPKGFDNFVVRIKGKNLALYPLLEQEGKTIETYERLLRDDIYKKQATNPEFQRRLKDLQEQAQFFVSSRDVELVERFPPNDLFKVSLSSK